MAAPRRTLMAWTVATSLRFRYLVAALGALVMAVGIVVLPSSRLDVFPEFAPPRVIVQTVCLGLSTADVEELVTVPLEQALNGVDGLDILRSKSSPQLSSVELIFDRGVDLIEARQLVEERMTAVSATLPTWAAPPVMLAPASATSRAVKIGMSSDDQSLIQMSMTAYWTVRARLLQVPGVANVTLWGERLQMLQVQVRPDAMAERNISLNQVMETTAAAVDSGLLLFDEGSLIGPGGIVETPNQRLNVRNVLPIITPNDLAQVPIETVPPGEDATEPGPIVQLGDVADVVEDHQPLLGDGAVNDGLGLMLIVEKLPWADTVELTRGVEEVVRDLEPALPSIRFDATLFQQENFIQTAIDNLSDAILLGFLLVVVILALFLFEWRVALISVLTIPLSITATLLVLYAQDQTINTMTLAGLVIALGVLVDDAIIDVENIVRRLRQHRLSGSGVSTAKVVLDASLEVRSPIVFATLIIVAASLPVFLLEGLTGAFFQPLALAYTLAILASLVVALTVTPALTLIMLRNAPIERRQSPVVRHLQTGYVRVLRPIIRRPWRVYAGTGLLLVLALAVLPTARAGPAPALQGARLPDALGRPARHLVDGDAAHHAHRQRGPDGHPRGAQLRRAPGPGLPGRRAVRHQLRRELDQHRPARRLRRARSPRSTRWSRTTRACSGTARPTWTSGPRRSSPAAATPSSSGCSARTSTSSASRPQEIEEILGGIDGVVNEHVDLHTDVPQIDVEVDLERAASFGLKPGDIRRAAAVMVASEEVGRHLPRWTRLRRRGLDRPGGPRQRAGHREPDDRHAVRRPDPAQRRRLGDHRSRARTRSTARTAPGTWTSWPTSRASTSARWGRSSRTSSRPTSSPAATTWSCSASSRSSRPPRPGCSRSAPSRWSRSSCCCRSSLGSWRPALLSFVTLPLALVGGVLVAFATGGILSIGSLVGFFTVFGIAARNGILLISHAQHLEREEGEPFGLELVIRAARERLAPILMTSLATGLALVPLVAFGERPGQEIEYPLAVVILGGLFTSTLLSLFVIPALYLQFGKSRRERAAAAGGGRRRGDAARGAGTGVGPLGVAGEPAVGTCGYPQTGACRPLPPGRPVRADRSRRRAGESHQGGTMMRTSMHRRRRLAAAAVADGLRAGEPDRAASDGASAEEEPATTAPVEAPPHDDARRGSPRRCSARTRRRSTIRGGRTPRACSSPTRGRPSTARRRSSAGSSRRSPT